MATLKSFQYFLLMNVISVILVWLIDFLYLLVIHYNILIDINMINNSLHYYYHYLPFKLVKIVTEKYALMY